MDISTLSLPLLTSLLLPLLLLLLLHSLLSRSIARSPNYCPFPNPLLGDLLPFLRNLHRFLDWSSDLLSRSPSGTVEVRGPLGLHRGVCVSRPAAVDHLLRANFANYAKGDRIRTALADLLGGGIFNADGALWALQRKTASREFTARSLKSFVSTVVHSHLRTRLLPLLASAADASAVLDLQDVLRRFAFDNICTVAFGTDPSTLGDPNHQSSQHPHRHQSFFHAFDEALSISTARLFFPAPWIWKAKKILNIGSERKLKNAIKNINEYAEQIIETKQERQGTANHPQSDLLSRFTAAIDDEGSELGSMFTDQHEKVRFLRDIVISFVLAGKDSTSAALTYFFWLLAANPRCEEKAYEEISRVADQGGEETELGFDELKGMQYLHAAITEALRLYPPVPIDSRVAAADDVLPDGTEVKAGWFADYSAYAMARSEEVWGEDCREFVPERWLDEGGEFVAAEAAKFPVFHAGPRTCLGREMAYVQMKVVAAAVIRRFKVELVAEVVAPPPYELSLTLKMKGGLPVRIKRRKVGD